TLEAETIHNPEEELDVKDVAKVPAENNNAEKELETANMLIDQMSAEFITQKYKDEYGTALMDLIEAKKDGDEVTKAEEKPKPDNVTNLMDARQESLDRAQKDKKSKTKRKTAVSPKEKKKVAK